MQNNMIQLLFMRRLKIHKLKPFNKRGSTVIAGLIAGTLLSVIVVSTIKGYFSVQSAKSIIEHKTSLVTAEDGIITALAQARFYMPFSSVGSMVTPTQFIDRMFGGAGLVILNAGTLIPFNEASASQLAGSSAADAVTQCKKPVQLPNRKTDPAAFVFCFSLKNTASIGRNTLFGSDSAFAMIKATLKKNDISQGDLINLIPTWGDFVDDSQRNDHFQAEITYAFFWGKALNNLNSFEKRGLSLKDLR